MMFETVPFKKEHVMDVIDQPINKPAKKFFLVERLEILEELPCFTGMIDGVPMVCGGMSTYWPGRGMLWCVFNEESKRNFIPVFRGIKRYLDEQLKIFHRIEMAVPIDFHIGKRRAELLGFKCEVPHACQFFEDGSDASIFVLTRKH